VVIVVAMSVLSQAARVLWPFFVCRGLLGTVRGVPLRWPGRGRDVAREHGEENAWQVSRHKKPGQAPQNHLLATFVTLLTTFVTFTSPRRDRCVSSTVLPRCGISPVHWPQSD
jgi:hypothetical protein